MYYLFNVGTEVCAVGQHSQATFQANKRGRKRCTKVHGSYLMFRLAIQSTTLGGYARPVRAHRMYREVIPMIDRTVCRFGMII
jgi:hypothetical protein